MTGENWERKLVNGVNNNLQHWIANRSTASMGYADVDLFSSSDDGVMAEVKGRGGESIYATGTTSKEQLEMLRNMRSAGFNVAFFIWWKGAFRGKSDLFKFRVYSVNEVKITKGSGMPSDEFFEKVYETSAREVLNSLEEE